MINIGNTLIRKIALYSSLGLVAWFGYGNLQMRDNERGLVKKLNTAQNELDETKGELNDTKSQNEAAKRKLKDRSYPDYVYYEILRLNPGLVLPPERTSYGYQCPFCEKFWD